MVLCFVLSVLFVVLIDNGLWGLVLCYLQVLFHDHGPLRFACCMIVSHWCFLFFIHRDSGSFKPTIFCGAFSNSFSARANFSKTRCFPRGPEHASSKSLKDDLRIFSRF